MHQPAPTTPPGVPDFYTRERFAPPGHAPVEKVEVAVDDGPRVEAGSDPAVGEFAWRGWRYRWGASPGEHSLACRATDATGEPALRRGRGLPGEGNKAVRPVRVRVTEG